MKKNSQPVKPLKTSDGTENDCKNIWKCSLCVMFVVKSNEQKRVSIILQSILTVSHISEGTRVSLCVYFLFCLKSVLVFSDPSIEILGLFLTAGKFSVLFDVLRIFVHVEHAKRLEVVFCASLRRGKRVTMLAHIVASLWCGLVWANCIDFPRKLCVTYRRRSVFCKWNCAEVVRKSGIHAVYQNRKTHICV